MALPGAVPTARTGVGARDGEPVVFSREEQAEAQRRWKRDHVGNASVTGETGPAAKVDLAVDEVGADDAVSAVREMMQAYRHSRRVPEGGQGNTPAGTGPSSVSGRSAAGGQ